MARKNPFSGLSVRGPMRLLAGMAALLSPGAAFAQETCDTAQPITPGSIFFDNSFSTTDGPSNCGQLGADLWYSFTADANGTATFSTCDQTFMDTVLNAYADCKGTSIVCLDDSCGFQTTISFPVMAGQDYYLQLGGFAGELGSGFFSFTLRADGACCMGSSCELLSEAGCMAAGGTYRGDGTACATAMCAQLGACCLPPAQGLCRVMLAGECASAGGTFSGEGTSCVGASPFNGSALVFDGATTDVDMGDASALTLAQGFTLEAWVRPESVTGVTRIISKGIAGVPGSNGYGFGVADGRLRFTTYNVLDYDTAGVYLTPGQWTHIAMVFDQFNTATFFVNGTSVEAIAGFGAATPSSAAFQIGANAGGIREHFHGVIDEVRVWNVERTFGEIADNFDNTLAGNEPGLIGYWRMDEGAGDTVGDMSPSGLHGTRHNAAWVATQTCETATFGACCLPNGSCVLASSAGCALGGGTFSGNGTSCGSTVCPQPGACCLPVSTGLCRVLLPADCAALGGSYEGAGTTCDAVGPFAGAALELHGGTDGVDAGSPAALDLTSGFTLEAWIYPTTINGAHRPIAKGQPGVEGFGFGVITGGRLRFTTFGVQDYNSAGSYIQTNRWAHIAVVFTAGFRADYYVNGQFVESVNGGAGARPTAQSFFIGRASTGNPDAFLGRVDEIRVWNIERSATDLAASFDQALTGAEPGLVGYWRLDEGSGTTTTDETAGIVGTFTGAPSWISTDTCGGCPADWNGSGVVNSQDFFDFLNDFFQNNADFNDDDVTNSQDFFDFLAEFFTPC